MSILKSRLLHGYVQGQGASASLYHNAKENSPENNGSIIVCEHGYVDLGQSTAFDNSGKKIKEFIHEGGVSSNQHFINAVRSRKEEDIRTPVLQGHLSAVLSHMGNISYRVGKEVSVAEVKDVINRDPEVLDALERTREHLLANGVDLDKSSVTLGPWLKMDSAKERFVGPYSDLANKYITREYREPFVIRDEV